MPRTHQGSEQPFVLADGREESEPLFRPSSILLRVEVETDPRFICITRKVKSGLGPIRSIVVTPPRSSGRGSEGRPPGVGGRGGDAVIHPSLCPARTLSRSFSRSPGNSTDLKGTAVTELAFDAPSREDAMASSSSSSSRRHHSSVHRTSSSSGGGGGGRGASGRLSSSASRDYGGPDFDSHPSHSSSSPRNGSLHRHQVRDSAFSEYDPHSIAAGRKLISFLMPLKHLSLRRLRSLPRPVVSKMSTALLTFFTVSEILVGFV